MLFFFRVGQHSMNVGGDLLRRIKIFLACVYATCKKRIEMQVFFDNDQELLGVMKLDRRVRSRKWNTLRVEIARNHKQSLH